MTFGNLFGGGGGGGGPGGGVAGPPALERGAMDWSGGGGGGGWMPAGGPWMMSGGKGGGGGGGKGKGKVSPTAISALTLLAFMFFLNILQNCLKEAVMQNTTMTVMMMMPEATTPPPPAPIFENPRFRRDADADADAPQGPMHDWGEWAAAGDGPLEDLQPTRDYVCPPDQTSDEETPCHSPST